MKLSILILLFALNTFAYTTSELVVLKRDNFIYMGKVYKYLSSLIIQNKTEEFCTYNDKLGPKLLEIYEQDMELASSLKEFDNSDFYDYSEQIKDNAYTDFITVQYFQDNCTQGKPKASLASFVGIETNLTYIKTRHSLWMNAFCDMIPGKCQK